MYAAAALSACSVFEGNDGFGQSWSGKPLAQLKHAWGQPAAQQSHVDGSTEVRYDLTEVRCTYWFTADKGGKIVSYCYAVGHWGSCRPV